MVVTTAVKRRILPSGPAQSPAEPECFVLKGHSGASVVLHSSGAQSFVRKTAGDPSQNDRLLRQMEKQREFCQIGLPFPRVLASGTDQRGYAYFDMTYISGRTVADCIVDPSAIDAQALLHAVDNMLWLFRSCQVAAIPPEHFRWKIADIVTRARGQAAGNTMLLEAIDACAARMLPLDWSGVPISQSHGDLTLENIMLGSGRDIVFIDCDENWVTSYWLDVAKLFQDFYGHWCLRELYLDPDALFATNDAIAKLDRLANPFRALTERQEPELGDRLNQLAALNLFRALPYAAGPRIAYFICERVMSVLQD